MAVAQPNWLDVGKGFVPTGQLFTNPDMLYIAIGILGATVMPHNLYLHSAVIQTRAWSRCPQGRRAAIKYGTLDSSLSLLFAFLINASILILAGAAFYYGADPHRCAGRRPQQCHALLLSTPACLPWTVCLRSPCRQQCCTTWNRECSMGNL
jgi:NRAMP (natural resistance-associated macrophage protein)-like metal ion transporter